MSVALPSIEHFFLLMLIVWAVFFSPLLGIAVYARLKGKPFEWGAYWALGALFGIAFTVLVVTSGVGPALSGSVVVAGLSLIVLAPAYALVWRVTGHLANRRERLSRSGE
jgi:hypothetical protein